MAFSDDVVQQRAHDARVLKRWVTCGVAGSLLLHGVVLGMRVRNHTFPETEPQDIAIVVTEPVEPSSLDEPEIVDPPDSQNLLTESAPAPDPSADSAAILDQATLPPLPQPEPIPSPIAEPPVNEPIAETQAESEVALPQPTPSPPPEPALRDWLNDLRSPRQPSEAAVDTPATRGEPRRFLPRTGSLNVPGASPSAEGGTGSTDSSSAGRETAAAPGTQPSGGDRAGQGSRSREITCRGCDFDYPESANGAEGRAQVIVETDSQGRVVSVTLSRSSGNAELDRAALEQARRRVRLDNARGGESYPLDIDFVQPNSDAARRARERGDRRSITVTEPEAAASPSPAAATRQPTAPTPQDDDAPAATATPAPEVEPSSAASPSAPAPAPGADTEARPAPPPRSPRPSPASTPRSPQPADPEPAPSPAGHSQPAAPATPPTPAPRAPEPTAPARMRKPATEPRPEPARQEAPRPPAAAPEGTAPASESAVP